MEHRGLEFGYITKARKSYRDGVSFAPSEKNESESEWFTGDTPN